MVKHDPHFVDTSSDLHGVELPDQPSVLGEVAVTTCPMQSRLAEKLVVERDRDGVVGRVVVKVDLKLDTRVLGNVVVDADVEGRAVSREGFVQGHGDLAQQAVVTLCPVPYLRSVADVSLDRRVDRIDAGEGIGRADGGEKAVQGLRVVVPVENVDAGGSAFVVGLRQSRSHASRHRGCSTRCPRPNSPWLSNPG